MILSNEGSTLIRKVIIEQHIAYIEKMVAKGGPNRQEYTAFDCWLEEVHEELRLGKITEDDLVVLREAFGEAVSTKTMQGLSLQKPHGYPGDYEIIDKIYLEHMTDEPSLQKWDGYYHAQSASIAVRNRKAYFLQLMNTLIGAQKTHAALHVLNVASGPARDISEFYQGMTNGHDVRFSCVDIDEEAIDYAKELCKPFLSHIDFHRINALRFRSDRKYQLIWSAGLFDYLGDKGFQFLLSNLLSMLGENGELVIGNFAKANPTREYMEIIADWPLHYRNEQELIKLATDRGVSREDIRIGRESEGVNLFLHIKRGSDFLDMEE